MRNLRPYLVWIVLALLLTTPTVVLASGGYDLSWWTVDGGGHTFSTSTDGVYSLSGTIGQPDAGVMSDATATFVLSGGFWNTGVLPVTSRVYLPLVVRNH